MFGPNCPGLWASLRPVSVTGRGLAADPHPPLAPHSFTSSGKHKLAAKSAGNSGKASDKKAKAPRALDERDWNKRY